MLSTMESADQNHDSKAYIHLFWRQSHVGTTYLLIHVGNTYDKARHKYSTLNHDFITFVTFKTFT